MIGLALLLSVMPMSECVRSGDSSLAGVIVRDMLMADAAGEPMPAGRFDPALEPDRIARLPGGWLSGPEF